MHEDAEVLNMSNIKIDKGVPMPKKERTKYPFSRMDVGDSFAVGPGKREIKSASNAAYRRNQQGQQRFATRNMGGGIVRIFRVK